MGEGEGRDCHVLRQAQDERVFNFHNFEKTLVMMWPRLTHQPIDAYNPLNASQQSPANKCWLTRGATP